MLLRLALSTCHLLASTCDSLAVINSNLCQHCILYNCNACFTRVRSDRPAVLTFHEVKYIGRAIFYNGSPADHLLIGLSLTR